MCISLINLRIYHRGNQYESDKMHSFSHLKVCFKIQLNGKLEIACTFCFHNEKVWFTEWLRMGGSVLDII